MNRPFVLLLLEDSEEDIFLFRRAISKLNRDIVLQCVGNGKEAQKYLRGQEKFDDRATFPLPSVIFSDFHLPGMGGMEFLEWLRGDVFFRPFPCVIFSGSANPSDVNASYDAGVTSFIVKPLDFSEWVSRLEVIFKFWMDIAQRPPIEA